MSKINQNLEFSQNLEPFGSNLEHFGRNLGYFGQNLYLKDLDWKIECYAGWHMCSVKCVITHYTLHIVHTTHYTLHTTN